MARIYRLALGASGLERPPGPRTNAADAIDCDAGHVAGRRILHRRELDLWAKVRASQPLQQFRPAAFEDAGAPVEHEILDQPEVTERGGLHRKAHPVVGSDVLQLPVFREVTDHHLITLETYPYDGYLGTSIGVQGRQVGQEPVSMKERADSGSFIGWAAAR